MVLHHILVNYKPCYIILETDIIIKQNISPFCFPNTWVTQTPGHVQVKYDNMACVW